CSRLVVLDEVDGESKADDASDDPGRVTRLDHAAAEAAQIVRLDVDADHQAFAGRLRAVHVDSLRHAMIGEDRGREGPIQVLAAKRSLARIAVEEGRHLPSLDTREAGRPSRVRIAGEDLSVPLLPGACVDLRGRVAERA